MKTMPYKQWLYEEADRVGLTKRSLENRIRRGKHPMPAHRMINSRNIEVLLPESDAKTSQPTWGGLV
jgi:hypothetical protein